MKINEIKVDGGVSVNNFFLHFQADILNTSAKIPQNIEVTVLGVAYLADLATGLYKSKDE